MSVSIEDMKWEAELLREEMEQLSEDKLGKLENMAHDYADAYISQVTYDDPKTGERELSDEEIEGISSSDKYDLIIKYIH